MTLTSHVTLNPAVQGPGEASSVPHLVTSLHGYETCAYPQQNLDRPKADALQDSGVVIVCHLSCCCVWECKRLLSYTLTCSCAPCGAQQAFTEACAECTDRLCTAVPSPTVSNSNSFLKNCNMPPCSSLSTIVCLMMLCIACVAEALSATGPDCFVFCATGGDSLAVVLQ